MNRPEHYESDLLFYFTDFLIRQFIQIQLISESSKISYICSCM